MTKACKKTLYIVFSVFFLVMVIPPSAVADDTRS